MLNAYERGRREPGVDALVRVLHASGYDLRLAPRDQAVEDRYLGTVLSDVIGLAESLPTRRRGALGPPVFRRTAG